MLPMLGGPQRRNISTIGPTEPEILQRNQQKPRFWPKKVPRLQAIFRHQSLRIQQSTNMKVLFSGQGLTAEGVILIRKNC